MRGGPARRAGPVRVDDHGRHDTMALLTLYHAGEVTLAADRLVHAPGELAHVGEVIEQARALGELREAERARVEAAERAAAEAGTERGRAEGYEAALEHIAVKLVALAKEAAEARERLRAQAGELALGIVRKIARDLGPAETVAALAASAARQLAPHEPVVLRVHPELEAGVRERLGAIGGPTVGEIEVAADPALGAGDCTLETEFGQVRAGLELQLEVLRERFYGHG